MDLTTYTPDAHGFIDYFIETYGDTVRYATDTDRFYIYDGKCWVPDGKRGVGIRSLIQEVAKKVTHEGTGETAKLLAVLGKDSTGVGKLTGSLQNDRRVWCLSRDFSSRPYLVNFQDCTLDVRVPAWDEDGFNPALGVKAHEPSDMLDSVLPVRYIPELHGSPEWETPLWDSLIGYMCGYDQTLTENLMDALAYSLYGGNPEQYMVFLVGEANTGKSQVLELMDEFLGELGGLGKIELITATRFGEHDTVRSALRDKRFVMLGEASAKLKLDEGKLKDLTGSAWVPTRELSKEQVDTKVTWTMFVATNWLPALPNLMDEAVARRLWIFDLPGKQIPESERDTGLKDKILARERFAVVNKLAFRCRELFSGERRLSRCQACVDALAAYRDEYDTVSEFCHEMLMADDFNSVSYNDLHESYLQFCRKHAYVTEGKRGFLKRVEEVMCAKRDSSNSRMKGVTLVAEAPAFA